MLQQLHKSGKLDKVDELAETAPVGRTIMVVESNPQMQDIFRAKFKQDGNRALVMRNPSLALRRFDHEPGVADIVIFSCIGLGRAGLEAFNEFSANSATAKVPAILLLDKDQDWQPQKELPQHQAWLQMPVKMRQLRDTISELIK